jgi:opacity protein-like surface antigen
VNKPARHTGTGLAFGIKFVVVGIEAEYATINEKTSVNAPQLRTGMVNALVQTPTSGAQAYATVGGGIYREKFLGGPQETNTGINLGAGLKLTLVGPVKLRLDYRLFKFRGDAVYKTVHRVYAGLNAGF